MKKKTLATASLLLALLMPLGATPLAVYADEGEGTTQSETASTAWDVSRSKDATGLDENYTSEVTLSLPSAEEKLSSDVVFVLDTSDCVGEVMNQVSGLVAQLKAAQEKNKADIKVGVVVFKGSALPMFDGKLVSAEDAETTLNNMIQEVNAATDTEKKENVVLRYLNAGKDFIYKGSNLHSGLLGAQALLNNDGAVKDSRKYVVTVTDGMTYYWNDKEGSVYAVYNDELEKPTLSEDDPQNWHKVNCLFYAWQSAHKIDSGYTLPSDFEWNDYISGVRNRIAADGDQFVSNLRQVCERTNKDCSSARYFEGSDPIKAFTDAGFRYVPLNEGGHHALGIERSVVACLDTYQEMVTAGYQCYTLNPDYGTNTFPGLFTSKLNEMANKGDINFNSIQNDILYAVGAGSEVEDKMGSAFDLVPGTFQLTVGGKALTCIQNDNTYSFGDDVTSDRFVVTYNKVDDSFTWKINENVSNFAPVQLSYKVKLTNPSTAPGTYEVATNEYARLTPKDSTGVGGQTVEFDIPQVSYTVSERSLSYDANGGEGAIDSATGAAGESVTVAENVFTRNNYTFTGWNTKADGTGTAYKPGDSFTLTNENTVLYAQWSKNAPVQVKVSYNANGGAGTMESVTGDVGSKIVIRQSGFTRSEYTFTGWNTQADGKGTAYKAGDSFTLTDKDTVLYAQWSKNSGSAGTGTNGTAKPTDIPKTGDNSNLTLWFALLIVSGGAVIATAVISSKKKRSEK